jgi:hypothetical protein
MSLPRLPSRKHAPKPDRRRALELIAGCRGKGCTASRAPVTIPPHLALDAGNRVTPMPDNFFASVHDHVIAFLIQLPDRVLLPVREWINENPEATVAFASLAVAVLAFRSSQETSKAQHKHNQLSVRRW